MENVRWMHLLNKNIMKTQILLFTLLLVGAGSKAQHLKDIDLKTTINEVTVFLEGAQITRTGTQEIGLGKSLIRIKGLSPHMDGKSIQVKAKGDFTLLSVNHSFDFVNALKRNKEVSKLEKMIDNLNDQLAIKGSRILVLQEKQSLLDENKNLGGSSGTSLTELKQAIEFYDKELSNIKNEERTINFDVINLKEQKSKLEKQIATTLNEQELPSGEIDIRIESDKIIKAEFVVTYLVANAGWYPNYDIRVDNIDSPISLRYKADVYQNTGVDWENVKLKFSNANPSLSGAAPELSTWYLNYARNTIYSRQNIGNSGLSVNEVNGKITSIEDGSPLPGVNIVVKGTTVGTVTDFNGNYSLILPNNSSTLVYSFVGLTTEEVAIRNSKMDLAMSSDVTQLSEVVTTGISSKLRGMAAGVNIKNRDKYEGEAKFNTITTVENQTTVEFEIKEPYSIESQGELLSIDLINHDINTIYEYYAVPKLNKDAFLIARIIDWDQYNLLEGEVNLYFEDAYVGRSVLNAKSMSDTLDISLGRDKNVVVGRTKLEQFTKRRTIGSSKIESRGFEINVRNKKDLPLKLTLFDQIPVSMISDIEISTNKLSGGQLEHDTGQITWVLQIDPQEQKTLEMTYEVKYPKKEKLYLE